MKKIRLTSFLLITILLVSSIQVYADTGIKVEGTTGDSKVTNNQQALEGLSDEEAIEELTIEPESSDFDGYTVKLSDDPNTSVKKDIAKSDESEIVVDNYVSVEDPENALDFAEPEEIEYITPNYYMYFDDAEGSDDESVFKYGEDFENGGAPNDDRFGQWKVTVTTEPAMTTDDGITTPEPIYITKASFEQTIYEQWNHGMVKTHAAWQAGYRGEGVTIAVVDSGLYSGFQDIKYSQLVQGHNFLEPTFPYYEDWKGHGTQVTSVFFAQINNNEGKENNNGYIAGITDKVNVMPIKVKTDPNNNNKVTGENYLAGIKYAREHGADIINISMGMYYDYAPMEEQINMFAKQGGITVAPVGNHNKTTYRYPASYDHVIAVGGVDITGNRWNDGEGTGANYNDKVDVVAPAKQVLTLCYSSNGNQVAERKTGCSYAVPHVAALAAVAKQYSKEHSNGKINVTDFKNLLIASSTDKGTPGKDNEYGYGLINYEEFIRLMTPSNTDGSSSVDYYNIKFVTNGGKFKNGSPTTYTGKSKVTLPKDITKTGYNFGGWYKTSNFSDKKCTYLPVGASGDRVFYAKWTAKKPTLKFNVNGGKAMKTKSKTMTYAKKVGTLPTPTRKGYTFLGWYTKSNNVYTPTRVCKATSSITVYAKWTKKKVIKYVPNSGTVLTYGKAFTKGKKIGTMATPTKTGYKFKGWYTKKKGGVKITKNRKLKYNKNYIVYAQWKKA